MRSARELLHKRLCIHISSSIDTCESENQTNVLQLLPIRKGKVYCIYNTCLLYTSPSPRDVEESRMPSSA